MTSSDRAHTSPKRDTRDSRSQVTIPSRWEKLSSGSSPSADRDDVLTPPFDVGKDYEALEHFSTGGMGCTYKGRNKESGQEVIIKIPHDMPGADARFERECETLRHLCQSATCPYIAQWLDSGSIEDKGRKRPYLVMELVQGATLRQVLQSRSVLPWDEVETLLKHVNQALLFMNSNGVSHRDIKPDNLIYDENNRRWVLVDFGIAHDEGQQVMQTLISNEGTWDYMSPEQIRGKKVDIRSDIYSLGKVAWEALIGTCPRVGTEYPSKYVKEGKENPSGSGRDVDDLIRLMVADNLEERFASPDELSSALERTAVSVGDERRRRRRKKILLRSLLTVLFIGAISTVAWFTGDYVIGNKIEDAARKTDKSVALQEIENIPRPLWMGESAYEKVVPGLRRETEKEEEKMRGEYEKLHGREFEQLSVRDRIERCNAFIKKWEAGYSQDPRVKKIKDTILPHLETDAELEEKMKPLQDGKLNIDGCWKCLDVLKIDKYAKSKLAWGYREKLRENFQRAYKNDVDTKITRHQYSEALKELDNLASANIVGRDFIDNLRGQVENARKEYDYSCLLDRIEKMCDAKDYAGAREAVDKYKEKYPDDTRSGQMLQWIAEQYKSYIIKSYIDDEEKQSHQKKADIYYEECVERIREFVTIFHEGEFSSYRNELSEFLLRAASGRILDIGNSRDSQAIKIDELSGMDWSECNEEHRAHLNKLRNAVIGHIKQPTYATRCVAEYWYQRAPIRGIGKPTVYRVHIERVVVSMSDEYYKEMKGKFDADPEVCISRFTRGRREDELYNTSKDKSKNIKGRQWFEVEVDRDFMFDIEEDEIRCSLKDGDTFDKAHPQLGRGKISPDSTSGRWRFDDGTTIEIYYKAD